MGSNFISTFHLSSPPDPAKILILFLTVQEMRTKVKAMTINTNRLSSNVIIQVDFCLAVSAE